MIPKVERRYQTQPDRAACWQPRCTWHREGPSAELLGHAHAENTGHQVRVWTGAVVIFGKPEARVRV